jgi:hypothetical protein
MNQMSIKLNLTTLKHGIITTPKGQECIVIPIVDNNLYKSEVGNIYLDLIAWPLKTVQKDQTHLVKQSLPKTVREGMTAEKLKEMPIIGNLKTWDEAGHTESAPTQTVAAADAQAAANDLPF